MKVPILEIQRSSLRLIPDSSRVLIRPYIPRKGRRITSIIARALTLSPEEVESILAEIKAEFSGRHINIEQILLRHYHKVKAHLFLDREPTPSQQLLIGSYFTSEYSLESAALFNPSIVPHPDQSNLQPGHLRFILSLRATGEGHISSIEFRSGVIDHQNQILLDPTSHYVTEPEIAANPYYNKYYFDLKIREMGFTNEWVEKILQPLNADFTLVDLREQISLVTKQQGILSRNQQRTIDSILLLAQSNYEVSFRKDQPLSSRVIFPVSHSERNGIEDARFVRFVDENNSVTYYATYTAYDGKVILPQLIETKDFFHFNIVTLNGRAVQNKGWALFPKKIGGRYAMISRQDDENLFLMYSDNIHFWNEREKILKPTQSWEFIKLGNCGSPIETERGWVVITHGVGPMRKYCIGAILLDFHDPARVIGRLKKPLIKPNENERHGYVPNVVYSCGAILHQDTLIIPYAMSDFATSFATISLPSLLAALLS